MNYVIGAVVGLLWGAVIAWVNSRINKSAIAKNTTKALMKANLCRTGLDIFGLGMVFLLRKVLPFSSLQDRSGHLRPGHGVPAAEGAALQF